MRWCWDSVETLQDTIETLLSPSWDKSETLLRWNEDMTETLEAYFLSHEKNKSILWLSSVKSELACRYGMCILYSLMEPQLHIAITEYRSSAHRSECKKSKTCHPVHTFWPPRDWWLPNIALLIFFLRSKLFFGIVMLFIERFWLFAFRPMCRAAALCAVLW
jgi:uncharacterized membrane protein